MQTLALALVVVAPSTLRAATFTTQSFPVPISVEGERVSSSLLLQFEIERYGFPFEAFAKGRLDRFETLLRDFVLALRTGDLTKVTAMEHADNPEQARWVIDAYRRTFAAQQILKVVGRVPVGEDQLFICERVGPNGPVRFGFTVSAPIQGLTRVEVVAAGQPLESLIVDVLQQEVLHPKEYAPVEPHAKYRYAFPLGGAGTPGAHPVVLHLNGTPLDAELFQNNRTIEKEPGDESTKSAPLDAYRTAYAALRDCDLDHFWESYTEKSRQKLLVWARKMKPEQMNSYCATARQPRRLRFLINADPITLVFYTVGTQKRLLYEYLFRSAAGYKLTNAYFEDTLDDVLGNTALFPTEFESFSRNVLAGDKSR
jgi:hypothetical protein